MSDGQQQKFGETIEEKTRHARQQLLDLFTYLSKSDGASDGCGHGLSQTSVTDVLEKFGLWAANLGALQGPTARLSLDHRLSDSLEVREEVLRQLEDISEAADDLLNIVLGARENRLIASGPDLERYPTGPRDESHMILEVISEAIGSLFRIGILIRRATTRDRFKQALQASDLAFPPEFDVNYVREKHTKTRSSWLSARLGGAIAKRRQLISYCRDHRSRLGAEQTLDNGTKSQKEDVSSKATTFAPSMDLKELEVEEEDAMSFVSASTVTDPASFLQLPSLADLSPERKPFECPICFTLQVFQKEKAWKKHAFRDLKAYVCTLGGSECDEHLFGDRTTWFNHEMNSHRATYTCSLCDGAKKTTRSNLRSHLALHGSFTDHQLEALEDATRDVVSSLRARDCPFCDEWAEKLGARNMSSPSDVIVSVARFKNHVAAHQEQLAIFALPRAVEEDESLEEETSMGLTSGSDLSLIVDEVDKDRLDDIQAQVSDRYQPETSRAAMERFEKMCRDADSILSRTQTWGTHPRSLPDSSPDGATLSRRILGVVGRGHIPSADDPPEASRGKAPLGIKKEGSQLDVNRRLEEKEEEAAYFRSLNTESSGPKATDPDVTSSGTPLSRRSVRGSTSSFKRAMSNFFRRSNSEVNKD